MTTDEVEFLNSIILGTPYSFPGDDLGRQRTRFILDKLRDAKSSKDRATETFRSQSKTIRANFERDRNYRLVFESNAIEGSTVSLEETQKVLTRFESDEDLIVAFGLERAIEEEPKILEALGLGRAHAQARLLAKDRHNSLREVDIRELHRLILPDRSFAGRYKLGQNYISQADHVPVAPGDVPEHMRALAHWLEESTAEPLLAACVAHAWLTHVHPFDDGNGRIARLLANYALAKASWPPIILRSKSDRAEYLEALARSDEGGDILPLFELFVRSMRRSLSEMLDPSFALEVFQRVKMSSESRFALWESAAFKFYHLLSQELTKHGLFLEMMGLPDYESYMLLLRRDRSGNCWFAKVRQQQTGFSIFLLWFGFASQELDEEVDEPRPSIFVSVRDRTETAVHPYRWFGQGIGGQLPEVSLRPSLDGNRGILKTSHSLCQEELATIGNKLAKQLVTHAQELQDWHRIVLA